MSTRLPGFSHFGGFLHHFVLAKLAISCIRFKQNRRENHWERTEVVTLVLGTQC